MNLFENSNHTFDCIVGNNTIHKGVNIYFASTFIKGWKDTSFIKELINMDVCTFLESDDDSEFKLFKI